MVQVWYGTGVVWYRCGMLQIFQYASINTFYLCALDNETLLVALSTRTISKPLQCYTCNIITLLY